MEAKVALRLFSRNRLGELHYYPLDMGQSMRQDFRVAQLDADYLSGRFRRSSIKIRSWIFRDFVCSRFPWISLRLNSLYRYSQLTDSLPLFFLQGKSICCRRICRMTCLLLSIPLRILQSGLNRRWCWKINSETVELGTFNQQKIQIVFYPLFAINQLFAAEILSFDYCQSSNPAVCWGKPEYHLEWDAPCSKIRLQPVGNRQWSFPCEWKAASSILMDLCTISAMYSSPDLIPVEGSSQDVPVTISTTGIQLPDGSMQSAIVNGRFTVPESISGKGSISIRVEDQRSGSVLMPDHSAEDPSWAPMGQVLFKELYRMPEGLQISGSTFDFSGDLRCLELMLIPGKNMGQVNCALELTCPVGQFLLKLPAESIDRILGNDGGILQIPYYPDRNMLVFGDVTLKAVMENQKRQLQKHLYSPIWSLRKIQLRNYMNRSSWRLCVGSPEISVNRKISWLFDRQILRHPGHLKMVRSMRVSNGSQTFWAGWRNFCRFYSGKERKQLSILSKPFTLQLFSKEGKSLSSSQFQLAFLVKTRRSNHFRFQWIMSLSRTENLSLSISQSSGRPLETVTFSIWREHMFLLVIRLLPNHLWMKYPVHLRIRCRIRKTGVRFCAFLWFRVDKSYCSGSVTERNTGVYDGSF